MSRLSLDGPQNCGIGYFSTPGAAGGLQYRRCRSSTHGTLIDLKRKESPGLPYEGCSER